MLESMLNNFSAKRRPWELLPIGILYYSVACILSLWVFTEYSSIVSLTFTVIAVLPLIYNMIRQEEEISADNDDVRVTIKSHGQYFLITMFFFSGLVIASALWYIFVPPQMLNSLFEAQIRTLTGIPLTGYATMTDHFTRILFNNLKVLFFCIGASFIYGAGAIFILTWNATVIGAAIGFYIRSRLAMLGSSAGMVTFAQYFGVYSTGFLKFVIHGVPEILAYFIGGLAGGIISVGIVKKEFKDYKFVKIFMDASYLIILAVVVVFIAAILEVWVTPTIFR